MSGQKLSRLASWATAARKGVASRLSGARAMEAGGGIRSRLPALPVDILSDALASAGSGGALLRRTFLVVVVLPTIFFWLYSAFWQSHRYVAETRLTVREAKKKDSGGSVDAGSIMAKMSGGGSKDSQNSFIVLNYVKSRAIVIDLGGRAYLERKFSGPGVDYFSRLSRDAKIEDLWRYWLNHVSASVDTVSGILTIRVDAFQPGDALDIARDVIRLSEDLVNRITLRNRGDALSRAESEVALTRQKLADARETVLQFRNQNVLIDPGARAASLGEMINKLTLERIEIVNALSTLASSLSADSPSQRLQRTRLAAIDQQLADLKKKLTDSHGADAVSAQLANYERLKLEEQFAERMYTIAQTAFQTARQDLERQQLYLVTVVTPTLPEGAAYPRVIANTILVFAALLILWSIVSLVVASIIDQVE
jgi:capsular polysaccharide transport system permease protein